MDITLHSNNPTVEASLKLVVNGDKLLIIDTKQDIVVASLVLHAAFGDNQEVYGYFLTFDHGPETDCVDKNIVLISHKN